jgi:hypothetical protein
MTLYSIKGYPEGKGPARGWLNFTKDMNSDLLSCEKGIRIRLNAKVVYLSVYTLNTVRVRI